MEAKDYIIGTIAVLGLIIGLINMFKKKDTVSIEEFTEMSNTVSNHKEILRNSKA